MRNLAIVVGSLAVAGCTAYPPQPFQRTPAAESKLQSLLAGRVAGPPQACLPSYRADSMINIDSNTVLFRDGATYYRNDFQGGCSRLDMGYTLVTRTTGSSLCRGDIAQVVDLQTGSSPDTCSFGYFVPYRRVR